VAKRRSPARDALAYAPQAALLAVPRLLPYRARLAYGGWIGRRAVQLPKLRRRIEANLRHVFPEMDAETRARIARETGDTFGRTFLELMDNAAFHAHGAFAGPRGPGAAAVEEAIAAGTGAVIVTGHFGQYEAVRAVLKVRGVNCAGAYRPTDNPHLNAVYRHNLELGGTPMFPKGRQGVRGMVKHLAKRGFIGLLFDQYDRRARRLDFVGRPAPTAFVPAELALKFKMPLIPMFGIRQPDGEHVEVYADAPVPHSTAAEMMQAANDSLAARIRAHPGQYYWLHRRWEKDLPGLDG
jgi:Kdo2-lipid IVA lauroyltransferase/acyltransferase